MQMPRRRAFVAALFAVAFLAEPGTVVVAQEYRAGVSRVDITPEGPIRQSGFGHRNHPSEGVEAPLFLKVLALGEGERPPLVLITADLIGFSRPVAEGIAARICADLKVPRENVMLVASHTHAGPVIEGNLDVMFGLEGKDAEVVHAYAVSLEAKAVTAATEAVRSMSPARLSFRHGRATFGCSRRVCNEKGVHLGVNPIGPHDEDVPVLRVDDPEGNLRAVAFGYACHCTGHSDYKICGDWAGYAQQFVEEAHPGVTAFFVTGCGADVCPRPAPGMDIVRPHGLELAGAVSQALKDPRPESQRPLAGPLHAVLEWVDLPLSPPPSRQEFEKRLQGEGDFMRRHAERQLATLDREGKLPAAQPCPVQVWRLGSTLTLVAIGGEVVVDYALRLKSELGADGLWVAAYANEVFCYVPTARHLMEGGYEVDYNLIYYGIPSRFHPDVEKVLVAKVHELVNRVR